MKPPADFYSDVKAYDSPDVRAWWEDGPLATWWPGRLLTWNGLNRSQLRGMDVALFTPGGAPIVIDIKTRSEWWGDLLLEIEHRYDDGSVRPGWALDPDWGPTFLAIGAIDANVALRFDASRLARVARSCEARIRARADREGSWRERRNLGGYVTRCVPFTLAECGRSLVDLYPPSLSVEEAARARLRRVG